MNSPIFFKTTIFHLRHASLVIFVAIFVFSGAILRAEDSLTEFTLQPTELAEETPGLPAGDFILPNTEDAASAEDTPEMALPEVIDFAAPELPEVPEPQESAPAEEPAEDAKASENTENAGGFENETEIKPEMEAYQPPVGTAAAVNDSLIENLFEPEIVARTAVPEPKKMPAPPVFVSSRTRETELVRAIQNARPAVVNIRGEKMVKTPAYDATEGANAPQPVNGMGTGVIIDPRGYIATNFHVVDGVRQIEVTTANQKSYIARLLARDRVTDLAIIKIEPVAGDSLFQTIPIGISSDLMIGETIIAIGNPFGYEHTVTRGIISALNRSVRVSETQLYENLIQVDASINPGNSGGPLLNIDGEMIGINVAVREGAQGIGFAIPVDSAMQVITRMIITQSARQHWTGMTFADQDVNFRSMRVPTHGGEIRTDFGVKIQTVEKNSPAEEAGLQAEDVLLAVEKENIGSPLDFVKSIMDRSTGDSIEIYILRNGKKWRTYLTLGRAVGGGNAGTALAGNTGRPENAVPSAAVGRKVDAPAAEERRNTWNGRNADTANNVPKIVTEEPPAKVVWEVLGLNLNSVAPGRLGKQYATIYNGGLLVQSVCPDGLAQQLDIRPGDILLGILRWETLSVPHVQFILSEPEFHEAQSVNFLLLRDGLLVSKKMTRE